MKNILELINALDSNYYKMVNYHIEDWNNQLEHQEFIKKFFQKSGKMEVMDSLEADLNLSLDNFERATHTNSVFFLGCLLYEKLNFQNKINFKRAEESGQDEFYFIWFLTTLVHDFGYIIENNPAKYLDITEDIKSLKEYFEIEKDLLKPCHDEGRCYIKHKENIKKLIEHIPEYYKKRFNGKIGRSKKSKIDHGIVSGLILFDRLVKNRETRYKQQKNNNDNLYWKEDLDIFYVTASHAIAVHNIRMKPEIICSQNDDAFLYLLWIVDTIEPTKAFPTCKSQYVMENIMMEFNSSTSFTIKNKEGSNLDFKEYIKNIKNLEKFLNINIETEENKIILSWK